MDDPSSRQPMGLPANIDEDECAQMFRRGLLQHDSESRKWVEQHLSEMLRGWFDLHPLKEEAYHLKGAEHFINETFESFWQTSDADNALELGSLAVILRYLQASMNSVILEALRNTAQPKRKLGTIAYPYVKYSPAMEDEYPDNGSGLWEHLLQLLADEREQRLAYLFFHCGLKPGEVVRFCPQEFGDLEEVYRLKHTILERFLRNDTLLYTANKS